MTLNSSARALAVLLALNLSTIHAADAPARLEISRVGSPVRIDGILDEEAWQQTTAIPVDHEWFPGDGPAPVETTALLTYDAENLYVAFRAADPEPARIRARFADRDIPTDDDTVGFLIDPFHDGRRAFQFRINPLGVQMDAVNSDVEGTEDFSWDAIWESAGQVTAEAMWSTGRGMSTIRSSLPSSGRTAASSTVSESAPVGPTSSGAYGGNREGSDVVAGFQGPRQSEVTLALAPNQEHFQGITYHNTRYSLFGSFQPTGGSTLSMQVRWGEDIDVANNRKGEFVTLAPGLDLRLGRRWQGRLDWIHQDFDVHGGRLFTVDLAQTRMFYHFNRRSFLRAILQYQWLERNPDLYRDPTSVERQTEDLLTQLLFSYRLNAQTVFLLGYSDNHAGIDRVDLTQTDRTVFLKIGYALLL